VKYAFIKEQKTHAIRLLCDVLKVSRSGYYDWYRRGLSKRDCDNQQVLAKIRALHAQHKGRYGSPRIQAALLQQGEQETKGRVASKTGQ